MHIRIITHPQSLFPRTHSCVIAPRHHSWRSICLSLHQITMSASAMGESETSNMRKRKLDNDLSTEPSNVQGAHILANLETIRNGFDIAHNADYRMFYLHATRFRETVEYSRADNKQKQGWIRAIWQQIVASRCAFCYHLISLTPANLVICRTRKGLSAFAYCRRHRFNPVTRAFTESSSDGGKSAGLYGDNKTVLSKTGTHNGEGSSAFNSGPTSTQSKGTLVVIGESSRPSKPQRTKLPSSRSNASKEPETLASSSQNNPSQPFPQIKNHVSQEASKRNVSTTAMLNGATKQDRLSHHQNANVQQNEKGQMTIADDLRREIADLRLQIWQDMAECQISLDALTKMMENHSERLDAIQRFLNR